MNLDDARYLLMCCYRAEVEARGHKVVKTASVLDAFDKVAASLIGDGKHGLLLYGQCGNGKSTMLRAIRRFYVTANSIGGDGCGYGIEIVSARGVIAEYTSKDGRRWARWCGERSAATGLLPNQGLAIDDMGEETVLVNNYGTKNEPMIELLEERYNKQLYTIVTTNLDMRDVRPRYGDRIADRFNEWLTCVSFKDNSFR